MEGLQEEIEWMKERIEQLEKSNQQQECIIRLLEALRPERDSGGNAIAHSIPMVTEAAKLSAELWKTRGDGALEDLRFEDALECYKRATELNGREPIYYLHLAMVNTKLGNYSEVFHINAMAAKSLELLNKESTDNYCPEPDVQLLAEAHAELETRRLNAEEQQLTQIFPDEIWCLIFDELETLSHLQDCSNASLYFRKLLQPRLHQLQGVCVLEQLLQRNYIHLQPDVFDTRYGLHFRNMAQQLGHVRLVSKSWCQTVDAYYKQNCEFKQLHEFTIGNLHGHPLLTLSQDFLDHFEVTHRYGPLGTRDPFTNFMVSINAQIYNDLTNEEQENATATRDILIQYGSRIQELLLSYGYWQIVVDQYQAMHNLLQFTPNLKTLHVYFHYTQEPILEEQVFQDFPHLDKLDFINCHSVPANIIQALMRNNNHISHLRVDTRLGNQEFGFELESLVLPRLEKLEIIYLYGVNFLRLEPLEPSWPLRSLRLDLGYLGLTELNEIFCLIRRKWGSTLIEMELELEHDWEGDYVMPRLELEKLEVFKLSMRAYRGLDFILPLSGTLKELKLVCGIDREAPNLIIQNLLSYHTLPSLAYIWQQFPKLERVECEYDENKVITAIRNPRQK